MTKIRDMARITPYKKATTIPMSTPAITNTKYNNANNPGFKKFLADRHVEQLNLQDIILVALEELQQPVSTLEMQHYLKAEGNIDIISHRVKYALDQLVASQKASAHLESVEERKLRADGAHVTSKSAYLFNSGSTPRPRTVAQVVAGYRIFDVAAGAKARAGRPRKARVNTSKPIGAPDIQRTQPSVDQGSAIDYLIEKIVSERTRDLQAQLNEANAKLAQFKKLLS
jgi:hypothetical protein